MSEPEAQQESQAHRAENRNLWTTRAGNAPLWTACGTPRFRSTPDSGKSYFPHILLRRRPSVEISCQRRRQTLLTLVASGPASVTVTGWKTHLIDDQGGCGLSWRSTVPADSCWSGFVLRMTTSPLAADVSGCRDIRWLDLAAGCQGLPEQIAALCRTSTSAYWARAAPVPWPRPAGKFFGIRRVPPCGAQRTARGAGCCDTRAVVAAASLPVRGGSRGPGRRIAADLGRAHGTHRPCPLTCVETWRSRGEAVGERCGPSGARGGRPRGGGPLGVEPLGGGPRGGGQGPDAQRRPCVALLLPVPRQAPRRRDCARRRRARQPDRQQVPDKIKGLSCGSAGRTMPPRLCTGWVGSRTSTGRRRAGTRARRQPWSLIEVGGRKIAYRRAGGGHPLVLLHGAWSDGREWRPQLAELPDEFDVIAWDAPGCGGSDDPPPEDGHGRLRRRRRGPDHRP